METTVKTNSNGVTEVAANIRAAFERRRDKVLVLCNRYKVLAKKTLQDSQGREQGEGQFWTNRTGDAVGSVFGFVIDNKKRRMGFGLAHHMEYGKYLEGFDKAGNKTGEGDRLTKEGNKIGRYGALERTIKVLTPLFIDEVKKVFSD
jgi:hypothetical protein